MLLSVDISDFFVYFFLSIFHILGEYVALLKSVTLIHLGDISVTLFSLRLGVLFLQIFFGIVFILAPRLGSGSVMKGNGI